jgi:putative DNA primase/helicase
MLQSIRAGRSSTATSNIGASICRMMPQANRSGFTPIAALAGNIIRLMVCLVRNILTNEPQAIHRTALTPEGHAVKRDGKTFRMSLGPTAGGAIKLDPDEDATQGLCIGEGVETCLAGRQMGLRRVWSAVNTGGIARFPMLSGVDGLHIFRDDDANLAGPKDVEACAARWRAAGRDVTISDPLYGSDLNDELRAAA